MSDSQIFEFMIAAAIDAGRAIHEIFSGDLKIRVKADSSPVTAADEAAEAVILGHLGRAAPGVPIVAEEEVAAGRVPRVGGEFFLVDPLDGTKEFIAGRPDFTVNIALVRGGQPTLGVVYAPASAKLYAGDIAAGHAFKAEQSPDAAVGAPRVSIRVRQPPPAGYTAVASRSHRSPETDAYLQRYALAGLVSVGSSLKFCLVAAGEADLYPRLSPTMEWDTAAGHAVLAAAGGRVLAADGAPLAYGKPGFRNPSFLACGAFAPLPLAA